MTITTTTTTTEYDPAWLTKLINTSDLASRAYDMMIEILDQGDFIDYNEVQCTELAEYVAHELDASDWLDDPDHWIWYMPIELADRYES